MNSDQLIAYFQQIVQEIFEGVITAKDLLEERNKNNLLQSIMESLDRLGIAVEEVIPQEMVIDYFSAVDEASKLLKKSGVTITGGIALTKNGQVAKGFQRRVHLEAVQEIIDDTLLDLHSAIRTAKMSANNTIEKTLEHVKSDIAKGMITGDHNKVVSRRVAQSFAKEGLTAFITSDNKQLPLDFYAKTVTKTKMREASTQGHVNRYLENGVTLVKIDEHQPTCHVCASYQGMVISLTGEHEGFKSIHDHGVMLPPYHPNCEHDTIPFVIEYKTEAEIQKEKGKWEKWNPEKDSRPKSQQKAYEKEQAMRRQANAEKKQYARWKSILGEDAPKTIGAFRRMKRQNTVKFQELQSEYRSLIRQTNNS